MKSPRDLLSQGDFCFTMCNTVQICIEIFVHNSMYKYIDKMLQMMYNYIHKNTQKAR